MDEIYSKYSSIIYKYLLGLTKNKELAEELMQETFYSAILHYDKLKNDNDKILNWLYIIAKNKWKDYLKKKSKIKQIPLNENLIEEYSYENEVELNDEKKRLYEKINKLNPISKNVILMKINTELTFKEIGKILGKNESWAKTIYYRANNKLREEMKDG